MAGPFYLRPIIAAAAKAIKICKRNQEWGIPCRISTE